MQDLIESLNWRYATKNFDPSKKLSPEQRDTLAESLRLTASSFGLQAWKFLFIQDQSLKEELKPASWNQSQITDCSDLVVFLAPLNVNEALVDKYMKHMAQVRNVEVSSLDGFKGYITGFINNMDEDQIRNWVDRQIYIALGNLLTSAALLKIDTCAMEGFQPKEYDRILNLEEKGYRSVVACTIGFRSDEDKYTKTSKVRFPQSDVVEHL